MDRFGLRAAERHNRVGGLNVVAVPELQLFEAFLRRRQLEYGDVLAGVAPYNLHRNRLIILDEHLQGVFIRTGDDVGIGDDKSLVGVVNESTPFGSLMQDMHGCRRTLFINLFRRWFVGPDSASPPMR